jgi:hypothetical protein
MTTAALEPWTTIRLYAPGPNCLFAGFIDIASQRTEVLPVDYMALQQQMVAVDPPPGRGDDEPDEDIETRVVPLVFTLNGQAWYCLPGEQVSPSHAFACLGSTEAACKAAVNTLFERTRAVVSAAAAAATTSPAEGGNPDAA